MSQNSPITALMTHGEISRAIGKRARSKRESLKLTRSELSERSGVSVPTISRFELTGVATVAVLIKLAQALNAVDTLDSLMKTSKYTTIEEFLSQKS